ncbi:MAG: amidophosphoribosyltransferase [Acidobacteria bacterium]|nr:amidophosphoribosyltransferase [Acidobacteriota bacterium]
MGGFFGVVASDDCVADLFYGTDYHSHLGTQRGGLVVRNGDGFVRSIHNITNAQFRSKFEEDLPKMHGRMGLGIISDFEDQPLVISSQLGTYAIVTVGKVHNLEHLTKHLLNRSGTHFVEIREGEINPTELVSNLVDGEATFEAGISKAQQLIDGSCSLLLLDQDGILAARDRLGRTPVAIGQKEGARAVTMETSALPNLGYEVEHFLGPGEVVRITADGIETLTPPGDNIQICSFLWIYYGYPASCYEGINVEACRNRCGAALARADDVEADFVAGVPDSGIGHAIGYAAEAGLPYRRPFVKYTPTWPRSFMPQEQRVRDLVARMKLIPIEDLIEGNRLLFCEDSIVRGTQLTDIIRRLFDRGAREVHMRPACPPLLHSCKFLNFSRSRSELDLAGRKAIVDLEGSGDVHLDEYADPDSDRYAAMVAGIGDRLELTTLRYQRLDDMVAAIGLPREKLCTFCWNGEELYGEQGVSY